MRKRKSFYTLIAIFSLIITAILPIVAFAATQVNLDSVIQISYKAPSMVTFSLNSNGLSYTVTGVSDDFTGGELIIPSTYNGINITTIGDSAFKNETSITSVIIPDTVGTIKYGAFYGCTGLTEIAFPSSISDVEEGAFRFCSNLTNLTMEKSNSLYSVVNNCLVKQGFGYKDLVVGCANSVIPSDIYQIRRYAFSGCEGLTNITIPSKVSGIYACAFEKCSNLTSATFENPEGWTAEDYIMGTTALSSTDLSNTSTAAKYLKTTYYSSTWERS